MLESMCLILQHPSSQVLRSTSCRLWLTLKVLLLPRFPLSLLSLPSFLYRFQIHQ
jgi:hypothetical protein